MSNANECDEVKVKLEIDPKSIVADPYPCTIKNNRSTLSDGKVPGIFQMRNQVIYWFYHRRRWENFSYIEIY